MFIWNMSATTCTLRQPVTEAEPIVSAQFDAVEAVLLAELPLLEERVTRDVLFLARESHRRWSPCRLSVPTAVTVTVPPQAPPVTVDPVHLGLLTQRTTCTPTVSNRARVNGHVLRCIDASAELGCPTVGTFIGRDTTRSVRDNLRDAEAKVSFGGLLWERPSLQVSRGSHAPDRAKGVLACGRE
jgi:hypothetical protein